MKLQLIVQAFDDTTIDRIKRQSKGRIKIYARSGFDVLYIETPKERYVSANAWKCSVSQLSAFMKYCRSIGLGDLSFISPSSFAMGLWRLQGADKGWQLRLEPNDYKYRFIRSAYYGSRTEAYKLGPAIGLMYDINSSFPYSSLRARFGTPRSLYFNKDKRVELPQSKHIALSNGLAYQDKTKTEDNIFSCEGFSEITYLEQAKYPVLPVRKNGRIYFANGVKRGIYSHNEIRYAYERGIDILEVHSQMLYGETLKSSPFEQFVLFCGNMAEQSDFRKLWKLIRNGLFGRLAIRADSLLIEYQPSTREIVRAAPRHLRGIFGESLFPALGRELSARADSNIAWSSYILSDSRIHLHSVALDRYVHRIIYVDTDAMILDGLDKPEELGGLELGQWKLDKEGSFDIKGAKAYEHGDRIVLKGVPESQKRKYWHHIQYSNERKAGDDGFTIPYDIEDIEGDEQ